MMSWLDIPLDAGLAARLSELAQRCAVPPAVAPIAGLALLLRRYTGRREFTIRCADTVYRLDLTEDRSIRDLLVDTRRAAGPAPAAAPPVAAAEPFAAEVAVALRLDTPPWVIAVDGCPDDLAWCFPADLAVLLDTMAGDASRSTVDLLPVSAYERRQPVDLTRLHQRGDIASSEVPGSTIPAAFAGQVRRHPDRPAVLADDACLTYRELGEAVAATAAAIRAAGVPGGGTRGQVALLCRHGATTVTGLLAALVAGRAYVPLDPTFPAHRLAHTLADSAADVLVTDATHVSQAERLRTLADRPDLRIVRIEPAGEAADLDAVLAGLASPAAPDDPAYLLYTSGSTGTPKGVVQSHRNVLFGVANQVRNFAITPADRTGVLTSFGYDMAVTDTFSAILSGAAAVPVDIRTHGLGHLARTLAARGVTIYHSTPTVYRYLCASLGADGRLPEIRAVLLGGEEVTRHDVELARRHYAPDAVFVNGYGTTEISFAAQYHLPTDAPLDHAVVPVGHPLDGVDVLLVDQAGRPTCLTGEIVVRSPHVAVGYWRLPELTATRFGEHGGVRTYRTGDLARRLPDGRLVFLGRADRLVKIRGHRVELGEVEAALAALPGVGHAAVVARPRIGGAGPGDMEIIGYVVPAADHSVDPAATRAGLARTLPDFMLPRTVVLVDALPMGVTGKLDVDALPPPPTLTRADVVDGDPLASLIRATWCDVLGLSYVDPDATFLELGGHSLLMALVQQRLEAALGRRVPLVRLFEFPTVAGLAAHLRAGEEPAELDPVLARVAGRMQRRRQARLGEAS
jgi:amino acid adenylation domain-containing protein